MTDEQQLIAEFVRDASESAFAELVRRHIDLVYAAASRQLAGDADLAKDVAQRTFCELARKARSLTGRRDLSGWLYNTATFIARRMRRTEARRLAREGAMELPGDSAPEVSWSEVQPLLDDAMQELSEPDREAVVLRFFRNQSLAQVGEKIGVTENAARMRVGRALEKLRSILERRGIRGSAGALGAVLIANAVPGAPAGLAATVAGTSLASAAALSHAASFYGFMSAAKIKTAAVVLLLGGTATGLILSERERMDLKGRLDGTQRQLAEQQELQRATPPAAAGEPERMRSLTSELMRLRAEVTQLKAQASAPKPASTPLAAAAAKRDEITEAQRLEILRTLGIAKLNVAHAWGLAIQKFAEANQGRMPRDIEEATPHYPPVREDVAWLQGMAGNDFEITFQGAFNQITNPAQAIILREKEAFNHQNDGSASRTYLFADGHSEIHKAPGGSFESWEQEHQPKLGEPPASFRVQP